MRRSTFEVNVLAICATCGKKIAGPRSISTFLGDSLIRRFKKKRCEPGHRVIVTSQGGERDRVVALVASKRTGSDRDDYMRALAILETSTLSIAPEYLVWSAMKQRCSNRNSQQYKNYGARGIRVCEPWRSPRGFIRFVLDVGKRPSSDHSIGRIDNSGNYEPENVRWELLSQQAQNTRKNMWISALGKTMVAADWARRLGCSTATVTTRIHKGWPPELAVTTPVKKAPPRARRRYITAFGMTKSVSEWSRETGIPSRSIRFRIDHMKWSPKKALSVQVEKRVSFANAEER